MRFKSAPVMPIVALQLLAPCLTHDGAAAQSPTQTLSAEFPFESHFVEVLGSRMRYIDEGEGDVALFVHGNPTSVYIWRNVIPYVVPQGRVIAVDLIGMGESDKPDIGYTYADHYRYFAAFVEALGLDDIVLVGHDWGTVLALDYARQHEDAVRAVAFMEALVPPAVPYPNFEVLGPILEPFQRGLRDPVTGREMMIEQNRFVERGLPTGTVRTLTEAELDAYRAPFVDPESRLPTLIWPRQIPIGGDPEHTTRVITEIGAWMEATNMPMLHAYASPGVLGGPDVAEALVERVENIESAYIGHAFHFIQEDQPEAIGRAIADWWRRLKRAD